MQIHTIDVGFRDTKEVIGCYLVIGPDGPVLIETGPGSTLGELQAGVRALGVDLDAIRDVLVTHIHLDHAGAAGWWARRGARIYVHHVGAPHIISPERLWSSASRIYGDEMETLWGDMLPAPADKVVAIEDGATIHAGGLEFKAIETLGHARHHMVYRLGDVAFVGDAAGIKVPGEPFIDIPAPPPEYNAEEWITAARRLRSENFSTIYRTHFGPSESPSSELEDIEAIIRSESEFVRAEIEAGRGEREQLIESFTAVNLQRALDGGVSEKTVAVYKAANPVFMSVDGMLRYFRPKRPKP